jgi:surfactin synthase thioesterase subunit
MALSNSTEGEWIRRFHPIVDSPMRLICFPHAGGSATAYFRLSGELTPRLETLAVQYPGRQDRRREPCLLSIAELADRVVAALRPWTDPPYALFGHSMGSILAYEVALRLQAGTGAAPVHLFASGYPAPSLVRGGTVHRRDDAGVLDELRATGGTDPRWLEDLDLVATILPGVRGDYQAVETYPRRNDAVGCPITMLVGDSDPQTTMDEAEGWARHTTGEFRVHVFPGGHFYLDGNMSDVAKTILNTVEDGALQDSRGQRSAIRALGNTADHS